jgi:hypothetical protein
MGAIMKPVVRMENWAIYPGQRLSGRVYGHPRFFNGDGIITSPIIRSTGIGAQVTGRTTYGGVVETLNTIYVLGKVGR